MFPGRPYRNPSDPKAISEWTIVEPRMALVTIVPSAVLFGIAVLISPISGPRLALGALVWILGWGALYLRRVSPRVPHPRRREFVARHLAKYYWARCWAGGLWGRVPYKVSMVILPVSYTEYEWEPVDDSFQGTREHWG